MRYLARVKGLGTKSKAILVTAVLVLVAVALTGVMNHLVKSPSASAQTASIRVEATDFFPSTITIPAGTTVVWQNQSKKPARITSTPFPQHNDLKDLDSVQSIGIGETYSYTFTKAGVYGFLNYTNPAVHGTVIVKK